MRHFLKLLSVFLFATIQIQIAQADDYPTDVRIEALSSKGSGCPAGSVRWTLAPNSSAVSFLFDRYLMQGTSPLMKLDCQFRFLLKYPRNYRLKVVGVDYRGAAILPTGSSATVSTNILQTISRMARTIEDSRETVQGPHEDLLLISRSTTRGDWISCNGVAGMNYIFTSSVQLNNPTGQEAYLQIDSADVDLRAGVSMQLAWARCN